MEGTDPTMSSWALLPLTQPLELTWKPFWSSLPASKLSELEQIIVIHNNHFSKVWALSKWFSPLWVCDKRITHPHPQLWDTTMVYFMAVFLGNSDSRKQEELFLRYTKIRSSNKCNQQKRPFLWSILPSICKHFDTKTTAVNFTSHCLLSDPTRL